MPISMIKYIKTLRHVSISTDYRQGVCLYLVKFTDDDLLRSKHVEGLLCILMYLNIEIGILN